MRISACAGPGCPACRFGEALADVRVRLWAGVAGVTKAAQAKSWTLHEWTDGSQRSWPEPEPDPRPAWIGAAIANGWARGTWASISGPSPSHGLSATNVTRDVKSVDQNNPELDGMTNEWTGGGLAMALGPFGSLVYGDGGGHGGYAGNDVFRFDLDTRTHSELWPDTHLSAAPLDATFGEYTDGSSPGFHTYSYPVCTPSLPGSSAGKWVLPKSVNSTEGQTPAVSVPYGHALDLDAGTWERLDPIPNAATRNAWIEAGAGCWDTSRGVYWLFCCSQAHDANIIATWDPLAEPGNQWTEHRPANPADGHGWNLNGIEQVVAREPNLDILVTLDFADADDIRYLKCWAPTEYYLNNNTLWPITTIGTPPSSRTKGGGFDWSPQLGGFIWYAGPVTDEVWLLRYVSGSVGSNGVEGDLTFEWILLTNASNSITPETQGANDTSIYTRFRVVPYGNTEIAVYVPNVDGAVYAFLLPGPEDVP